MKKKILILGAGKSSVYLVHYLLKIAPERNYFITLCDIDKANAEKLIGNSSHGQAVQLNATDATARYSLIKQSDMVINMLTRPFQYAIAYDCIRSKIPMLSASYEDPKVRELNKSAIENDIIIVNELGLDPGIDHVLSVDLIKSIEEKGGRIDEFRSYGGSLPSTAIPDNPLNYAVIWNPRNILLAGEDGAIYKENNHVQVVPFHSIFEHTWHVDIKGFGLLEAYPNRDALIYGNILGVEKASTLIRGTLRYPGWGETWSKVVQLGLTNETIVIPNLKNMTYRKFTELFLPASVKSDDTAQALASFLNINPTGRIMSNLEWLGLLSEDEIGFNAKTAAQAMINLLLKKLKLPPGINDVAILLIEISYHFKENRKKKYKTVRTMIDYGEPPGFTAISKTVGLPIALMADLILQDKIGVRGCVLPFHPTIYTSLLPELIANGIHFTDRQFK
ncbi:MAG: saccharopine dehydrogenase NADP-binding domain-containing protein [Ignavibacteriaceae bacterium]|nr:saccharopine dehydrogenase NADP-binding domain-containing protein [Ignavibacteriaceae bacterium]